MMDMDHETGAKSLDLSFPPIPLPDLTKICDFSDVMARRDNYFHSCWMRLKQQRPDLYELMTQCELYIAGLLPPEEEPDADDPDDTIL